MPEKASCFKAPYELNQVPRQVMCRQPKEWAPRLRLCQVFIESLVVFWCRSVWVFLWRSSVSDGAWTLLSRGVYPHHHYWLYVCRSAATPQDFRHSGLIFTPGFLGHEVCSATPSFGKFRTENRPKNFCSSPFCVFSVFVLEMKFYVFLGPRPLQNECRFVIPRNVDGHKAIYDAENSPEMPKFRTPRPFLKSKGLRKEKVVSCDGISLLQACLASCDNCWSISCRRPR